MRIESICYFNAQGGSKGIKMLTDQFIYMIENAELISKNWSSGPRSAFGLLSDLWQTN